jgi:hypothetical protein
MTPNVTPEQAKRWYDERMGDAPSFTLLDPPPPAPPPVAGPPAAPVTAAQVREIIGRRMVEVAAEDRPDREAELDRLAALDPDEVAAKLNAGGAGAPAPPAPTAPAPTPAAHAHSEPPPPAVVTVNAGDPALAPAVKELVEELRKPPPAAKVREKVVHRYDAEGRIVESVKVEVPDGG